MTHSLTATRYTPSISTRCFDFSLRRMEYSRICTNHTSCTMEEIRPFVEHQPSVNTQRIENPSNTIPPSSANYIINVEDEPINGSYPHDALGHDHHHFQSTAADNVLNNIRGAANEVVGESQNNNNNIVINHNNNNNNNNVDNSEQAVQMTPETREVLKALQKYVLFIFILLAKGLYDYRASILNLMVLHVTFNHANNCLKREIGKPHNKSLTTLLFVICSILGSIFFINFQYDTYILPMYTQHLTIGELLWSVLIADYISKLITIICKVFLTCLPAKLLALRKRGKYYLVVEATSQLYRCVAPVQPWFYYFSEAYEGPEKILAVFFSALYMTSKGKDFLEHLVFFYKAIWKLHMNMNLDVSPSKEELIASGGICAICHEEYSMPLILCCKHIFCETCVFTWLDRERSCPLCRAEIMTDDPVYRDGHTTYFIQLF